MTEKSPQQGIKIVIVQDKPSYRPHWWDHGPKQATDPRKRRAMEETGRYLGERRDV